jgi:O-antigen/teichoic acid export membrane protein
MGCYFIPMNALSMTAGRTGAIPLLTLSAGGLNVALNLILVPRFGPLAAAANTAVGYGVLAAFTSLYAARVVSIGYEKGRIARIVAAAALTFVLTSQLSGLEPALALVAKCAALACYPALLWIMGFWTKSEKSGISLLVKRIAPRFGTIIPGN